MFYVNENLNAKTANDFLENLENKLNELNIGFNEYLADHICYRTSTFEEYKVLIDLLSQKHKLLIASDVGGREIATFKLTTPISFRDYFIDVLEIPSPKKGRNYSSGFEHIEMVIGEDFKSFKEKYPKLSFDDSGCHKDFNPELRLPITEAISIKFHHLTLEKVIEIEKNNSI